MNEIRQLLQHFQTGGYFKNDWLMSTTKASNVTCSYHCISTGEALDQQPKAHLVMNVKHVHLVLACTCKDWHTGQTGGCALCPGLKLARVFSGPRLVPAGHRWE